MSHELVAKASEASWLERWFRLRERGTTVRTEVVAGLTTFMTMAYILFVNPSILDAAGVPKAGATTATALAAGLVTLAMGLVTNYPLALASGMGLNAALAYGVVQGQGVSWQTAMGVVFVEGAIVTLLVLSGLRESVMNAIPMNLKRAIGSGIGLFLAFIGLRDAQLITASPATFVALGNLREPTALLALVGLGLTAALLALRVRGALLLGIVLTTLVGLPLGVTHWPERVASLQLDFSTLFQLDIQGALQVGLLGTIFAFLITDFFDTMGTVISVGGQAGFLDREGRVPGIRNVLLIDSLAAVVGGLFGCSSVTTYIESAAGVGEGGRTGLTSVVTGLCFLLALLFVPLMGMVPAAATAPALIVVGFLMMSVVVDIDFRDVKEGLPAFLTLLGIPFTFSIANGIGLGFVAYVLIHLLTGRIRDVHPLMYIVSALFVVNFILTAA